MSSRDIEKLRRDIGPIRFTPEAQARLVAAIRRNRPIINVDSRTVIDARKKRPN